MDADKRPSRPSDTRGVTRRILWIQNKPNHYFVQMLDALNSRGDVEYMGVFLCPSPAEGSLYQVPAISPHIFLGNASQNAGPEGYKRIGAGARDFIGATAFAAAIVGGYDSAFKRWVLRYCHRRGLPAVLLTDSNIRAERGRSLRKKLKRFAKHIFLHRIIKNLSCVIPVNRTGVAYWRYYGCPSAKITRSTYFCAVDIPKALAIKRDELFARYQLDPNCKLIFTAARLVPAKALHLMVEAFSQSGLAEKGWVWAVAGTGPLRQELEKLAAERSQHAGSIRFLGAVAPVDIPPLMAQSELFVLPSVYEPHGIVVTEAMAVGTPVVASNDCGAARDLVRKNETGWLFVSGDSADLLRVLLIATADGGKQLRAMRQSCNGAFARWNALRSPMRVIPKLCREWQSRAGRGL